jgi:hypothetical protein
MVGVLALKRDRWMGRCLIEVPFYWALCLSEQAFHAELRMLKVPKNSWPAWVRAGKDGACHWFDKTGSDGTDCAIICMRDTDKHTPIEVAGLLVHEAVHVWQEVRGRMGDQIASAEFEAYAVQRLVMNLMDAYSKTLTE